MKDENESLENGEGLEDHADTGTEQGEIDIKENTADSQDSEEFTTAEDIYSEEESENETNVYDTDEEQDAGDDFDSISFEERYWRRVEEEKQKKRKLIFNIIAAGIGAVVVAALITAFCLADTGLIGAYKENFMTNFRKLFPEEEQSIDIGATERNTDEQGYVDESDTAVKTVERSADNVKVVPFESAADGKFYAYGNGLICARTNYICYINSDGEIEWENNTSVVDPLLSVDGKYIAIGSENGNKLCLYDGSELVFEQNTEGDIRSVRVSSSGDIALVCDKENYKGAVSVYNRNGQEVFAWSSGQNDVISADISSASRRVAVILLNAEKKVYSIIRVFDINTADSAEMAFDDTILFKVEYTGDTITGFGDNSLVCMTSTGRVISDKRFDMVDIMGVSCDPEGNKLLYLDSAGTPVFQIYGRKGVLESEIVTDSSAECMDISGRYILYNSGRNVTLQRAGSDRVNEYVATMDILKLILINSSTYAVVHSNSIEIVSL